MLIGSNSEGCKRPTLDLTANGFIMSCAGPSNEIFVQTYFNNGTVNIPTFILGSFGNSESNEGL